MRDNPPQTDSASEIAARALAFVREDLLRQAFPAYGRDADFQRVREGFDILLAECTELSNSWSETLDRFEGLGQVSLMTVHKSKSLEFHTMIFFGLDNNTWWVKRVGSMIFEANTTRRSRVLDRTPCAKTDFVSM